MNSKLQLNEKSVIHGGNLLDVVNRRLVESSGKVAWPVGSTLVRLDES